MNCRVVVTILVLLGMGSAGAGQIPARSDGSVTIAYTGRLLGYLRGINPGQEQCVLKPEGQKSVVQNIEMPEPDSGAGEIPCVLAKLKKDGAILLGTGDNFAPAYGARFTGNVADEDHRIHHTDEPLVDSDVRDTHDKVGLFLQRAGYDALVPGKEDFYFGAYRLMKIGRKLRNHEGRLMFLADNLFLQQTTDPGNKRQPDPSEPDASEYVFKRDGIKAGFAGEATPWLVSLKFELDSNLVKTSPEGRMCTANQDGPGKWDVCTPWPAWRKIGDSPWERAAGAVAVAANDRASVLFQFIRPVPSSNEFTEKDFLQPGNYFFCLKGAELKSSSKVKPDTAIYCQALEVEEPMFCAGGNCELGAAAKDRVYQPYNLIERTGQPAVAVFGVVDGNLPSFVARENASWEPGNGDCVVGPHCRTSIHVIPPDAALQQALEFFSLKNAAFRGMRVLLAQMTEPMANELGSHIEDPATDKGSAVGCLAESGCPVDSRHPSPAFQLVMAKADAAHATPKLTLDFRGAGIHRPVVMTPQQVWDEERKITINSVSELTIRSESGAGPVVFENEWSSDMPGCERPSRREDPQPDRKGNAKTVFLDAVSSFNAAWNRKDALGQSIREMRDAKPAFQQFALYAMADYKGMGKGSKAPKSSHAAGEQEPKIPGADLALLQKRDFFFETVKDPVIWEDTVQEIIDRILWKDDLLSETNLTGAQIKKILKQSDTFESEEQDAASVVPDAGGRGLELAGVLVAKGENGTADRIFAQSDDFVDATVYKVATSNHIAGGETGYPDAADQAPGQEDEAPKRTPISALVCHALRRWADPKLALTFACRPLVTEAKYFVVGASGQSPNNDALLSMPARDFKSKPQKALTDLASAFHNPRPFEGKFAENRLEQYPLLDFDADKFLAGYQISAADTTQANLKNFSGITNSDISQPSFSDLTLGQHLRLLYRMRHPLDVGFEDSLGWERKRQDSLSGPTTTSWPNNTFTIGPVFRKRGLGLGIKPGCPRKSGPCPFLRVYSNKYLPHFYYVVHPFDFTIQPSDTTISLSGASGSSAQVPQHRAYSYTHKGGLRFEWGKDIYVESGWQWLRNRQVLSQLTYDGAAAACDLSGSQSLSKCFSGVDLTGLTILASYRRFLQEGLYWDSKVTLPFTKRFSYALDTHGDLFMNRPPAESNSALARYDVIVGNSLKVPLIGNFSLQPRFELVFYENQILDNTLFRRNFTMNLSYSFHRNSRVSFWKRMNDGSTAGAGASE